MLTRQIADQERIVADPVGRGAPVEQSIAAGLERERQPERPVVGKGSHEVHQPAAGRRTDLLPGSSGRESGRRGLPAGRKLPADDSGGPCRDRQDRAGVPAAEGAGGRPPAQWIWGRSGRTGSST